MQTTDLNQPDSIISRTAIPNLDLIISNDPDDCLPTAILHAPDGRMRLKNILQHQSFQSYDVIMIDSKGAAGVMVELVVLAATENVVGVIKPILPDVREFMRGTVRLMSRFRQNRYIRKTRFNINFKPATQREISSRLGGCFPILIRRTSCKWSYVVRLISLSVCLCC